MKRLLVLLVLLGLVPSALAFDFDMQSGISFNEDTSASLDLSGTRQLNVSGGETVTFNITGATNVIVAVTNYAVTFSAKPNFNGYEMLTFNATNGTYSKPETIRVDVLSVNDQPTLTLPTQTKIRSAQSFT